MLFYLVYGEIDMSVPFSKSKYRSDGVPAGLEIRRQTRASGFGTPGSFLDGFVWDRLCEDDPELAGLIAEQESCFVLRGTFHDPADLCYLRDTMAMVTYFQDQGGVGVCDPQIFAWRSADLEVRGL